MLGETLPTWIEQLQRLLSLRDYNTRIVLLSCALLGAAAGLVGSFMLLRKRALVADSLAHATLPGIGIAFMVVVAWGGDAKSLPVLLTGAVLSGLVGVGSMMALQRWTRLGEDAILGVVLSVFFALGICMVDIASRLPVGSAGLESFIYGKAASMVASDAWLVGVFAGLAVLVTVLLFKELRLVCFDSTYAASLGLPVGWLDAVLMGLVVTVVVVGLQAVGLILIVALMIIPPAAARFWTDRLGVMLVLAGLLGALSGLMGAALSALFGKLPSGPMVVLSATALFAFSLLFGTARGTVRRALARVRQVIRVRRQHLLRRIYELCEAGELGESGDLRAPVSVEQLAEGGRRLHHAAARLREARRLGWVEQAVDGRWRLTPAGVTEAVRVTRNHRLWELYLIEFAQAAPMQADRSADEVEHVIDPVAGARLNDLLAERYPALAAHGQAVPPSPHLLRSPRAMNSADLWIITTAAICAAACAIPGAYLVLRRMSMMGDAISHAVLPGLAAAFIISQSRDSAPMFVGAVAAGLLTALLTEKVRQWGKVDEGTSMGVVFTALFALGLVLVVSAVEHSKVDLDPGCVLYGAVEFVGFDRVSLLGWSVPRAAAVLGGVLLLNLTLVAVLYKELKLSSFDPDHAHSMGVNPRAMHYLIMTMTAVTAVAAFEVVGSILVVALLIVPAATARLLTDRLSMTLALAAVIGMVAAPLGHVAASGIPGMFGLPATSTAGSIGVILGFLLGLAAVFGPRHGVLVRAWQRRRLAERIAREDVLVQLQRRSEAGDSASVEPLQAVGGALPGQMARALRQLRRGGLIATERSVSQLTEAGSAEAGRLMRTHRLWESYLVQEGVADASHAHSSAERLEHATDGSLAAQLAEQTGDPPVDPHGKPIPPPKPASPPSESAHKSTP